MRKHRLQKSLVRDTDNDAWSLGYCGFNNGWAQCIPYEGNEHLIGTTDSPPPPEFKFGDKVAVRNDDTLPWEKGSLQLVNSTSYKLF